MAQADGVVANGTGSAVRADINGQLAALFTNHSGSTEPATTFAFQTWADTNTNTLKLRNSSNDGWVQLARLDGQFDAKTFNSNVTLNAQSDLRFADSDSSNWVAFQAPATVASNVTWTLPSADGTADQALTTNGSGVLSWADAGGTADNITEGNTSAEVVDTGSDGHFKVVTEGTEALRVVSSQRVGIGTTTPDSILHLGFSNSTTPTSGTTPSGIGMSVGGTNGDNGGIWWSADFGGDQGIAGIAGTKTNSYQTDLRFYTNNTNAARGFSERARIDSSGRLLVGLTSARNVGSNGGSEAPIQVETPNNLICGLNLIQNRNGDTLGPNMRFAKTRGSTVGSTTIVQSGDELGTIQFCGADDTDLLTQGAYIRAQVDATPGSNDMPGRLVFCTTPNGSSAPSEAMRINSAQQISCNAYSVDVGSKCLELRQNTNSSNYNGIMQTLRSNANNTSTYHFRGLTEGASNYFIYGNATAGSSSDERLKKNIETTRDGYLTDIRQLRVVKFNWKTHEDGTPRELGLIAQEVEQVFPGLVQSENGQVSDDDETSYKVLKHSVLPFILLKALQEADQKIDDQAALIEAQAAQLTSQAASIASLEARLTALENA